MTLPSSLRERNKLAVKAEILTAAVGLMHETQRADMPVEEICARAGVSRATFFNYFPQKELIFVALLERRSETVRQTVEAKLAKGESMDVDAIIGLFQRFSKENEDLGPAGRTVFGEVLGKSLAAPIWAGLQRDGIASLKTAIEGMRKAKTRPGIVEANLLAECLFAIYLGTCVQWAAGPPRKPGWLPKEVGKRVRAVLESCL